MGYNSSDMGVSPVVGVILLVAITVIITAVLGVAVFDLTDGLKDTNTGDTSVDVTEGEDYLQVQPVSSNYDDPIEILADGNVVKTIPAGSLETGKIDYSNVGNEETTITVRSGDRVLHQVTVNPTDDQYYKDPSTIDSSDISIVSTTDHYSGSGDRVRGTTESFEVQINGTYDPSELTYTWSIKCENTYGNGCSSSWDANIDSSQNKANYTYTSSGWNNGGDAAPKVTVDFPDGRTETYAMSLYTVYKPIQSVSFGSNESYYSGSETRIVGTTEGWYVDSITLHSKVSDVLGSDTPSSLSDYDYSNWRRQCDNTYGNGCSSSWDANINKRSKDYMANYTYLNTGWNNGGDAAPKVSISIQGISTTQAFSPSMYRPAHAIQSVSFNGNMSNETRNVGDTESWEVSDITLHSKVSDVLGSDTPSSLSDYDYGKWDRHCVSSYGNGCSSSWNADISYSGYTADYNYTNNGWTGKDYGRQAAPRTRISVPGISSTRKHHPSIYKVYE